MMAMLFNFREWLDISYQSLIEAVIQRDAEGKPLDLDLHFPNGELNPPVCRNTGITFDGKGFICFDFDQTLTTAWYGSNYPQDKGSHSTGSPNPKMLTKMEAHKKVGNLVTIVTARGEREDELTGDKKHVRGLQPTLTPAPSIRYSGLSGPKPNLQRDFHPNIRTNPAWAAIPKSLDPSLVYHLGAVSLHTKGEEKGPFIAAKMAEFHAKSGHRDYAWGILYDDGDFNIRSANQQQKKGIALAGIPVKRVYEPGGAPPAGAKVGLAASGM